MLLLAHITLGTLGLLLGLLAMLSRKRPGFHPRIGEAYHWVMLGVCVSAGALAILDWERLWMFLPITTGSYAFALAGYGAAKLRFPGWLKVHVIGQGGSCIALLTALLVVNWDSAWAWAIPTLLGTPLIARAVRRFGKYSPDRGILSSTPRAI